MGSCSSKPTDVQLPQLGHGQVQPQLAGGQAQPQLAGGQAQPQLGGGQAQPQLAGGQAQPQLAGGQAQLQLGGGQAQLQLAGGQVQPQPGGGPQMAQFGLFQILPVAGGGFQLLPVNPLSQFNAPRPQMVCISLIDQHGIVVDNVHLPTDPFSGRISVIEAFLHPSLLDKLNTLNLIIVDHPPFFKRIPDNTSIFIFNNLPQFLENIYGYGLNVRLRKLPSPSKLSSGTIRSKSASWKDYSDSRNLSVKFPSRNQPGIQDQGQHQQSIRATHSNGDNFASRAKTKLIQSALSPIDEVSNESTTRR